MTAIVTALKDLGPSAQKYLDGLEHIALALLLHALGSVSGNATLLSNATAALNTGLADFGWTITSTPTSAPK